MDFGRIATQLIADEGLRLKPYRCTAGKLTIGVGRNLDDKGISQDEAMTLLGNDVRETWRDLATALPWVSEAPEPVQEVLLNMAFNLGVRGLLGFKNTLALIQSRQYDPAARAMLDSRWAEQVGQRAVRLAAAIANCEHGEG